MLNMIVSRSFAKQEAYKGQAELFILNPTSISCQYVEAVKAMEQ